MFQSLSTSDTRARTVCGVMILILLFQNNQTMRTAVNGVARTATVEVMPNIIIDVTSRISPARTICTKSYALLHSYYKVIGTNK